MNLLLFAAYFSIILCGFTSQYTWSSLYVRELTSEIFDSLSVFDSNKIHYISLPALFSKIDIPLVCTKRNDQFLVQYQKTSIKFYNSNTKYTVNESEFRLAYAPVIVNSEFNISLHDLSQISTHIPAIDLYFNEHEMTLKYFIHKNLSLTSVDTLLKSPYDRLKVDVGVRSSPQVASSNVMAIKSMQHEIKTIVLDPGHGGKDPGAIGMNGLKEKDVVLSITLQLAKELEKRTNCKIMCTRTTDTFVPLRQRTAYANKVKADLFISIHTNSIAGDKKKLKAIQGYKVFFLKENNSGCYGFSNIFLKIFAR